MFQTSLCFLHLLNAAVSFHPFLSDFSLGMFKTNLPLYKIDSCHNAVSTMGSLALSNVSTNKLAGVVTNNRQVKKWPVLEVVRLCKLSKRLDLIECFNYLAVTVTGFNGFVFMWQQRFVVVFFFLIETKNWTEINIQVLGDKCQIFLSCFPLRHILGFIQEDYLRELLTTMGDRFTDEEVDELYREAPIDKKGNFNYIEFTRILKHGAKDKDDWANPWTPTCRFSLLYTHVYFWGGFPGRTCCMHLALQLLPFLMYLSIPDHLGTTAPV